MMFMPALMVGGHLFIAVVDKIPEVNFERLCREATSGDLGINDKFDVCVDDERDARDLLVKQWSGFDTSDRERCTRMATMDRTSSYIELLTCLELGQIARKLHATASAATVADVPTQAPAREREKAKAPAPRERLARHRAPAPPAPPEPQPKPPSGLFEVLCPPALRSILPACR